MNSADKKDIGFPEKQENRVEMESCDIKDCECSTEQDPPGDTLDAMEKTIVDLKHDLAAKEAELSLIGQQLVEAEASNANWRYWLMQQYTGSKEGMTMVLKSQWELPNAYGNRLPDDVSEKGITLVPAKYCDSVIKLRLRSEYIAVPPGEYGMERIPSPMGHDCFWLVIEGTLVGGAEGALRDWSDPRYGDHQIVFKAEAGK